MPPNDYAHSLRRLSAGLVLPLMMAFLLSCQRAPAPPGELDANPKPLDVGSVLVSRTGSADLTLSNSLATGRVDFSHGAPSGTDAAVFSAAPTAPTAGSLLNSQTGIVTISCTPTGFRSFQAEYIAQVFYGAPKAGTFPVTLKCKGVGQQQITGHGPIINVVGGGTDGPLDFGNQVIQTTSPPKQIIISNPTSAAIRVTANRLLSENAFTISGWQLSFQVYIIQPGQSQTLSITFKPTRLGGHSDIIIFTQGSNSFGVIVTGQGVAAGDGKGGE